MQRARERNVRRWKKRYLAEDAAGLDTTDSAVPLRAARQSLAEFAQATGGRVDSARVSAPSSAGAKPAGQVHRRERQSFRRLKVHEEAAAHLDRMGKPCVKFWESRYDQHETG